MTGRGGFIKNRGGLITGRGNLAGASGPGARVPILPPTAQIPSRGVRPPSTGYGVPTFAKSSGLARGIGRSVSGFVRGILPGSRR